MVRKHIGVLGASSLVGGYLLELLSQHDLDATAFSRQSVANTPPLHEISDWVSVAPIWVLPEHFERFELYGIKRIVALSSTSLFAKADSSEVYEKGVVQRLSDGEGRLQAWASTKGIHWIILRPTLIYGGGKDKNVAVIAKLIRRFGFFPLLGSAEGLRQPVHAKDVATACLDALLTIHVVNQSYNLSGDETLTYRDMVSRIFSAMGRRPRLVHVPLWSFRLVISILRVLPRYQNWSPAMAERMNQDLCFDHTDASRDFGYSPRKFDPFGEE